MTQKVQQSCSTPCFCSEFSCSCKLCQCLGKHLVQVRLLHSKVYAIAMNNFRADTQMVKPQMASPGEKQSGVSQELQARYTQCRQGLMHLLKTLHCNGNLRVYRLTVYALCSWYVLCKI